MMNAINPKQQIAPMRHVTTVPIITGAWTCSMFSRLERWVLGKFPGGGKDRQIRRQ
jgi:hypothetical protein